MIRLADLKTYLKVEETEADDELIASLESNAVAYLERQTNRYFGRPGEAVEVISGAGAQALYLSEPAVATPAPVIELANGDDWDTVDAADYTIYGSVAYHTSFWDYGVRNYRVTYTRGYTEDEEPEDIRQAVLQLTALWYEHRLPIATVTVNDLPFSVQRTIASWRRVRV